MIGAVQESALLRGLQTLLLGSAFGPPQQYSFLFLSSPRTTKAHHHPRYNIYSPTLYMVVKGKDVFALLPGLRALCVNNLVCK